MATVLVQHGTLRPGNILTLGLDWFKVRVVTDEKGQKVTEAPPSTPVLVSGWKKLPTAGETWCQVRRDLVSGEEPDLLSCQPCVCVCEQGRIIHTAE